jgi:hypothetical protein
MPERNETPFLATADLPNVSGVMLAAVKKEIRDILTLLRGV